MDWQALQDLDLSSEDYAKVLKAYYQHTEHSAWRYLLKPNPWMHERLTMYIQIPIIEKERWAAFEECQFLISLPYLEAKDIATPATDGYTVETRVEQFIKELALTGRAHNWEQERIKCSVDGKKYLVQFFLIKLIE